MHRRNSQPRPSSPVRVSVRTTQQQGSQIDCRCPGGSHVRRPPSQQGQQLPAGSHRAVEAGLQEVQQVVGPREEGPGHRGQAGTLRPALSVCVVTSRSAPPLALPSTRVDEREVPRLVSRFKAPLRVRPSTAGVSREVRSFDVRVSAFGEPSWSSPADVERVSRCSAWRRFPLHDVWDGLGLGQRVVLTQLRLSGVDR